MRCECHGMGFYRRNLPHWDPGRRPVFVTWRLHGAAPPLALPAELRPGALFALRDHADDLAPKGARWLAQPEIAVLVVSALVYGQCRLGLFCVHAFVVMPNHVHVLWTPEATLASICRTVKSFSARRANCLLGRSGPFWQHESYDHVVRDASEGVRIRRYIEANPVRAGLAARPEDFPWSSAHAPIACVE